jgi:hypothetical protein
MESNVAINGCGLVPDAGVVLLGVEELPPHASSIKTDAALAHRRYRIAGYLANMKTQPRGGRLRLWSLSFF